MSYPNIPDVSPEIDLNREDVINLLLASIAFEELGLAHIINAEAEKIQYVLGTLEGQGLTQSPTIDDLLQINRSVEQTLRSVIKKQMLLQFKLEDTISILSEPTTTTTSTSTTTTTSTTSTTTTTTKCHPKYKDMTTIQGETINT